MQVLKVGEQSQSLALRAEDISQAMSAEGHGVHAAAQLCSVQRYRAAGT